MTGIACFLCGFYLEISGGYLADPPLMDVPPLTSCQPGPISSTFSCKAGPLALGDPLQGSLAIGLEWNPRRWLALTAELRHVSAPRISDGGEDGAWIKARVFPFRRR